MEKRKINHFDIYNVFLAITENDTNDWFCDPGLHIVCVTCTLFSDILTLGHCFCERGRMHDILFVLIMTSSLPCCLVTVSPRVNV